MPNQVDPETKALRNRVLRQKSARNWLAFRQQFVGEVLDAVVIDDKGDGKMRVLTDNYIEATIDGDVGLRGKRFPIRLLELSDDVVTALRVSS